MLELFSLFSWAHTENKMAASLLAVEWKTLGRK